MLVCLTALLGNEVLLQMVLVLAGKGIEQFFFIAKSNGGCARAFCLLHQKVFQIKS